MVSLDHRAITNHEMIIGQQVKLLGVIIDCTSKTNLHKYWQSIKFSEKIV